jgi:RNA polymerase sigma-70 factor (ECF subfamily)
MTPRQRHRRRNEEPVGRPRFLLVDPKNEWELIVRCRAGSAAAFEPLVLEYQGEALRVASGLLTDSDDAADAVQDSFVRAFHNLGRLEPGSAFGPWFRTILRNHCIDRLRSPSRKRAVQLADAPAAALAIPESAPSRLHHEELRALVRSALGELSADHREVLVLRELAGFSYDEIARTTGVAAGTVASRIFHARAALKRVLEARGVSLEELLT